MKIKDVSPSCASKLKVLSDSTRLAVLEFLMGGPRNVGELMEELRVEQSLLSHHLAVLRDNGLVEANPKRQGHDLSITKGRFRLHGWESHQPRMLQNLL